MIIKLNPIFPALARLRTEKREKEVHKLTHEQWVNIDRIVMGFLFAIGILSAILFS